MWGREGWLSVTGLRDGATRKEGGLELRNQPEEGVL